MCGLHLTVIIFLISLQIATRCLYRHFFIGATHRACHGRLGGECLIKPNYLVFSSHEKMTMDEARHEPRLRTPVFGEHQLIHNRPPSMRQTQMISISGMSTWLDRAAALRGLPSFLVLIALAAVLRSASLAYEVMDIDEAHWTLTGRLVADGGLPYVDFVDRKPPLLFYLYAVLVAASGGNLIAIHLWMIVWVAATASVVRRLLRELG